MRYFLLLAAAALLSSAACQSERPVVAPAPVPTQAEATGSLGLVGDAADVSRSTVGGTMLMGGGTDVDAAMQWMIAKSGGGDFLILRATGTNAYNTYVYNDLGGVNSCETLLINSRTLANDPQVEAKIRAAEAVFISGGNQANYVNFWKDTKVEDALNYLRNVKQCPIGGTSAGNAIAGASYYSALLGSVTSAAALANPYNQDMTLGRDDFLNQPYLANTITDTHFDNPDRRGRLVTFMARLNKDYGIVPRGIGVDEKTAVCIEPSGLGKVFGTGTAFFLQQNSSSGTPERCVSGSSLDWYRSTRAVKVYKANGTTTGANTFNLATWSGGTGGSSQYYYVDKGTLKTSY